MRASFSTSRFWTVGLPVIPTFQTPSWAAVVGRGRGETVTVGAWSAARSVPVFESRSMSAPIEARTAREPPRIIVRFTLFMFFPPTWLANSACAGSYPYRYSDLGGPMANTKLKKVSFPVPIGRRRCGTFGRAGEGRRHDRGVRRGSAKITIPGYYEIVQSAGAARSYRVLGDGPGSVWTSPCFSTVLPDPQHSQLALPVLELSNHDCAADGAAGLAFRLSLGHPCAGTRSVAGHSLRRRGSPRRAGIAAAPRRRRAPIHRGDRCPPGARAA